jgi:predicted component of viral defense system (DUF524 family)
MQNLRLKSKYGELLIEPGKLNIPEEIYQGILNIRDARLILDQDAQMVNEQGQQAMYNGEPLFFEGQEIHFSFVPNLSYQTNTYSLYLRGTEQFKSKKINNQTQLSGSIDFANSVGFTEFTIRDLSLQKDIFTIKTEVYPQKIDYKHDFELMLDEITDTIYNLAFDFFKKTYLFTDIIDTSQKTLSQWLIILKYLFDKLIKSIDLILKTPNYKIMSLNIIKPTSRVRRTDKKLNKWLSKNKRYITAKQISAPTFIKRYRPTYLPECKKKLSYDTFENRFVVWGIKQIIKKINETQSVFSGKYNQVENKKAAKKELALIKNYKLRLLRRLNDVYFREVSVFKKQIHFSTVLTMAPGYRDFYFYFLLLNKGLEISQNDIFNLDLKDIATLYEYWCFLKIINILKENDRYELKSNDFIKVENKKISIYLKKGKESKVEFIIKPTQEKIKIYYNKGFQTPTYHQIPDNFIEFEKDDYARPFRYFFDAKYRFERERQNTEASYFPYSPPQDTIGQMHRYRDAVLEKSAYQSTYSEAIKSLGGLVLYPYPKDEEEFKKCNFFKSIDLVNIGAIPLHPGKENILFKKFLDKLFTKSAESNFEEMIGYDKKAYMKYLEEIRNPVLVGMIRESNNSKRISYLFKNKRFYIHRTKNANAFLINYIVLYNQKTKKIIGYSKVKNIYFGFDKKMVNPSKQEYIIYSLEEINKLDIDFTLEGFGQTGYFYTNLYVFKKLIVGYQKEIIKLNDLYNIRIWKEIKNLDKNCKIIRQKFVLDKENKDISLIRFEFQYKEQDFYFMQDQEKRNIFYIGINGENNKEIIFNFKIEKDLYSFIHRNWNNILQKKMSKQRINRTQG